MASAASYTDLMREPLRKVTMPVLTLADLALIEALAPDTRAAVERYIAAGGTASLEVDADETYREGWEDGCAAMMDEIQSIGEPPPPSKRRRAP